MLQNRTFGQKIAFGFTVTIALMILTGAISAIALRAVVNGKDQVINDNSQRLLDAERMHVAIERRVAAMRGFLLSKQESFIQRSAEQQKVFEDLVDKLSAGGAKEARLLGEVKRLEDGYRETADRAMAMRRADQAITEVTSFFDDQVAPKRDAIEASIQQYIDLEDTALEDASSEAGRMAMIAIVLVVGLTLLAGIFATVVAVILTRSLSHQIGSAVAKVQSSSAELQAASNQQAMGSKEQATAMSEISTTIGELLATSRQIAESARRVAQIANDTAAAADTGGLTIEGAQIAIAGIRKQVDLVVTHMLDLGKRSQEIGAVLDIVTELAEQTNILSINASIEAVTAGEHGKRFAVVAAEIRKLAARVTGSIKEIRSLIEGIRGSVNTTVMATESGSKAVDAGLAKVGEITSSFKRITGMVATTTDAAREIELSTKQQSSAVEQVTGAVSNVAQATKETEVSTGQTLQTAGELNRLSQDLMRLVQPDLH